MANKPIEWHTEKRKLSDLKPMKGNPRQATEKQVEDLTKSLKTFNLVAPIIINTNNMIIGGHFRYDILKKDGKKNQGIDVRIPSRKLTEKEVRELNIRLNKNLGEWDLDLLAGFDESLLADVGFIPDELVDIFNIDKDFDVLDNVDIKGESMDEKDYLLVTFEDQEEVVRVRDIFKLRKNSRVIPFSEIKKQWGIKI